MKKFNIEIASVEHFDNLVAEVWFGDHLISEINMEQDKPKITLFNSYDDILLEDFYSVLKEAVIRLKE
ncbi:hypothetical protein [Pasteurella sp. PK-2025]|uniref:hypothetical protein n=1 Tax=unclassified Pasteurella TaxID=2621516 RepID=UPI003C78DC79